MNFIGTGITGLVQPGHGIHGHVFPLEIRDMGLVGFFFEELE